MKQFSKKQSSHLSVVSPVSSSNCPRTLISTTPGYGSCSHQEHETRDILVTISNLEIYCREHRRWWCVSATRARLLCAARQWRRQDGCCDSVWGSTLLLRWQLTWTLLSELSKWALVISRSLIRQSPGQEQRSMSNWTTEHWISINSRIWQQGGVGSQTASASFVKNSHYYQNETFNIYLF